MERTIAIVGAGPAGLSASIQLSRLGVSHFIFERSAPGGLLRNGNMIANYTGVYPPVSGSAISDMMLRHFKSYSQKIVKSGVSEVQYDHVEDKFHLKAGNLIYTSCFIIAASGTKPVRPEILKNIPDELLKNIYFEITGITDLSDKRILIVGGGDCAFDYSLTMAVSNQIDIVNRTVKIKALKILREKVFADRNINYRDRVKIDSILEGESKAFKVKLIGKERQDHYEYDIIIFAVGREPDDSYLSYIERGKLATLISEGRIQLAGDIKNREIRQAVIAAGNGVESAMNIYKKLNGISDGCSI